MSAAKNADPTPSAGAALSPAQRQAKLEELARLKDRIDELERELASPGSHWQATSYYWAYYMMTGAVLGMFGAVASLLFNIIGSLLVGQHPLRLIQVYLTFPLGEKALAPQMNSGLALLIGVCLYVATGALLGVPFQVGLSRLAPGGKLTSRLIVASVLGGAIWLLNFYAILSWLQPALFGGAWIVEQIPWWVGLLTHLVFGWTMALLAPLGVYTPYRPPLASG